MQIVSILWARFVVIAAALAQTRRQGTAALGCRFSKKEQTTMVSRSVQFGVGAAAQCAAVGLMHTPVRADTLHVAAIPHNSIPSEQS
jgi:hypothetical protein